MFRYVGACVVMSLLLLGSSAGHAQAQAAPIEACKVWEATAPGKGEAAVSSLRAFFASLFQTAPASPAPAELDKTLYFTHADAVSSQPRCRKSKEAIARSHLWLPVGVVVRKLAETQMDEEKFWLVETEYGLKTFIEPRYLSTMGEQFVYFFADGAADDTPQMRKPLCIGQDKGQPAKPCTASEHAAKQYLSPKTRFATASAADFESLGYGGENFTLRRLDPSLVWKCGSIDVGIYAAKNARLSRESFGRLNTCEETAADGGAPNLDKRIKVVRFSDYAAYFGKKIDATVMRIESGLLERFAPELGTQKQCNETFDFKSESEISVKAGLSLKPLAAVELGGSAAKKYLWSVKQTLNDQVAVYVHAFNLKTELGGDQASAAPIQVRYSCSPDASAPQQAREVRISHPIRGQSGDFIFKIRNPGERARATPDSGEFGIDLSDKSEIYNQGYVFEIKGQKDYFALRDAAFEKLSQSEGRVREFYEKAGDTVYRSRMTSFLAHLVLATVASAGSD
jgi:hypothetical protein